MALYHKHRPQNFDSVIGQDHIVQTLSNEVKLDKLAHAYLFSGPRGIGKTTLARVMAKALNCQNKKKDEYEPCNKCESCNEISESRSIDVIEIDAASHTGVDNVRENIIENAQFRPTKSKYKIFIIDEVHMLSTSSFNALLKTLEEPPEYVIFILATTELHKLPATIISRCQRFNFKKIQFEEMKKYLEDIAKEEKIKIDKEVIEKIIQKSEGCARDAVSLMDQLMASGEKNITIENSSLILPNSNSEKIIQFVDLLLSGEVKENLILINQLQEDGINLPDFFKELIEILRNMMLYKADQKTIADHDLSDQAKKELRKLTEMISFQDLVRLIDLVMQRTTQIKTSPLPQLPLELLVVEWSENKQPKDNTDKREQVEKIKTEKKEEKTTLTEKIKNIVNKPNISTTLDEINLKWNEFISRVESIYPSLSFILKMAEVANLNGDTLTVSVKYSFHRDKLTEKVIANKIQDLLSDLMGESIKLSIIIKEDTTTNTDELQNLASSFGGEIIN